jgi:hypothetical protein
VGFVAGMTVGLLKELEKQLAAARSHAVALTGAIDSDDFSALNATIALRAAHGVHQGIMASNREFAQLREQLVPADGLGEIGESLAELSIRVIRMVTLSQLGRIRDAARVRANNDIRLLLTGRFHSVDDAIDFAHQEFLRITGLWMHYRIPRNDVFASSQDRARYRAIMRAALHATRSVRSDPDFGHLLRTGTMMPEWSEVCHACSNITTAFEVKLDAEPRWVLMDAYGRRGDEAGASL